MRVAQAGVAALISDLAQRHGLLYGILAVRDRRCGGAPHRRRVRPRRRRRGTEACPSAPALRALFRAQAPRNGDQLRETLRRFRALVEQNDRVLELIADAGEKLGGEYVFDSKYLGDLADRLRDAPTRW